MPRPPTKVEPKAPVQAELPPEVVAEGQATNEKSIQMLGEGAPLARSVYSARSIKTLYDAVQGILDAWGAGMKLRGPGAYGDVDRLPPDLYASLLAIQSFVQTFGDPEYNFELTEETLADDRALRVLAGKLNLIVADKDLRKQAKLENPNKPEEEAAPQEGQAAPAASPEDVTNTLTMNM